MYENFVNIFYTALPYSILSCKQILIGFICDKSDPITGLN